MRLYTFFIHSQVQDFYQQYIYFIIFWFMRYPWLLPQADWWYQFCWEAFLARKKIKSLNARKFQVKPHVRNTKQHAFYFNGQIVIQMGPWGERGTTSYADEKRHREPEMPPLPHPWRAVRCSTPARHQDFPQEMRSYGWLCSALGLHEDPQWAWRHSASCRIQETAVGSRRQGRDHYMRPSLRIRSDSILTGDPTGTWIRWCCPVWWSVQYRPRRTRGPESASWACLWWRPVWSGRLIPRPRRPRCAKSLKMCAALRIHWTAKD